MFHNIYYRKYESEVFFLNISKYLEFILIEKVSKKTQQPYYAIALKFKDYEFPLIFLTKDKFELLKSNLQ